MTRHKTGPLAARGTPKGVPSENYETFVFQYILHLNSEAFIFAKFQPGLETDRSWLKCAHGEEVPLVFGAPFLGRNHSFPYNFTRADRMVSLAVMTYWTNFAHNGWEKFQKQLWFKDMNFSSLLTSVCCFIW